MKSPLSSARLLLGVAFAVLPYSTATARIGETLEQCKARYGELLNEPVLNEETPEAKDYDFEKAGIMTCVTIFQGKAAEIVFFRRDKTPFNKDELDTLLEANKDFSWKRIGEKYGLILWHTANGSRHAVYKPETGILVISDAKWVKLRDDKAEKKEKEAFGGF